MFFVMLNFRPNSTKLCSGRGRCICGTCECKSRSENSPEKYSGKWCQCDSYSCPFYNNALCGGKMLGYQWSTLWNDYYMLRMRFAIYVFCQTCLCDLPTDIEIESHKTVVTKYKFDYMKCTVKGNIIQDVSFIISISTYISWKRWSNERLA